MASSTTRNRKRCAHNQPQLWADQGKSKAERQVWMLDESTKATGRRGLALARQAIEHKEPVQLDLFRRPKTSPN